MRIKHDRGKNYDYTVAKADSIIHSTQVYHNVFT